MRDEGAQPVGAEQWVGFVEGATANEDRLVIVDEASAARIVVDHQNWAPLVDAVDYIRALHCESAGCSPAGPVIDRRESPKVSDAVATLFAPRVRFVSTGESQFDAMMTWRAELEMDYLDDGDTPRVLVGYADFLTIEIGEHSIADLLDSISQDAEHFAALFDGDDVNDAVQEQFSDAMPFNRILLVTMVLVAEQLRGQDLGVWLVSEVIGRMAGAIDTLVLLYPYPAVHPTGDPIELAAVNRLAEYWRRTGMEHIEACPEFLGQSTAYTSLPEARRALSGVEELQISVAGNQLSDEPTWWAETRHVLGDEITKVR
ncbi:hypothetical protein [Mycobacteroides chelonae]|uniref:hypothetical protein n=1 Tax=Mycobacteroides chelonae TaxID=1774 RepID=UPI0012FF6A31|nr:hypothetical protein [Mycobacteroides chelonae]